MILAAGKGRRLAEVAGNRPKCLLKPGGKTILQRQLEASRKAGLDSVVVVVGYQSDQVRAHCRDLDYPVEFIENEKYATTNNIYTLWLARDQLLNGFVLFNADTLFHEQILLDLVSSSHGDALCVDDVKILGEEEMKVMMEDGKLTLINKTMPPGEAHGEYIGLAKFSARGARELFRIIGEMLDAGEYGIWYDITFNDLGRKIPIHAVSTGGLPWIEIDNAEDLRKAETVVEDIHSMS